MLHRNSLLALLAPILLVGCATDPIDGVCPSVSEGDLVVTEIHGPQSGDDNYGEWIEVYNASGSSIDVSGLVVSLIKLDRSSEERLIIRTPLSLEAGQYAVFGRQLAGLEPAHVDYGYAGDFDKKLFDSGVIQIRSCQTQIDQAIYRNLPTKGSVILGGQYEVSTAANDDETKWCLDTEEDEQEQAPGSPQAANPNCPEEES